MNAAVWWIRRDLRLYDNQALDAALRTGNSILPVFVLDPTLLDSPYVGPKRLSFLFKGLRLLDQDLRARGSRLIVRRGDPIRELAQVCERIPGGDDFCRAGLFPLRLPAGFPRGPFASSQVGRQPGVALSRERLKSG